jgi:DNA-binding HxlR family transcriptional regulator
MRPEYLLTDFGEPIAAKCRELITAIDDRKVVRVLSMKWALPVLSSLAAGKNRFSEVRESARDITGRALTLFLKEAQAAGLVERDVIDGYPPTPTYRLGEQAEKLFPQIANLIDSLA